MSNHITLQQLLPAKFTAVGSGKTYVGIDFGTSTTVVSIASFDTDGVTIKCEALKLRQLLEDGTLYESDRLPSVIAAYGGKVLVGEGASNLKYKLRLGKDIWYSFKMEMGADYGAKYVNSILADKAPFFIKNPKDAVRVFFMFLKLLINHYCDKHGLSSQIEYAVSIPASFEANQRKELVEALETNGMKVTHQSLIDEPNAAFISYVQECANGERPLAISEHYNPKILVFDFGGGTCDISILEIGKSVNGVYSKNLSISKFTQLGGNDIDRFLTYRYLLPEFLENNGKKLADFRTPERKIIASQLYKVAERLKILINKNIALVTSDFQLPNVKSSRRPITVEYRVEIDTTQGKLAQKIFKLSPAQLSEAMDVFTKRSNIATTYQGEEDYNNITMPINSAIQKAGISKDEVDYVLFIGGSAQSPYIQEALRSIFPDSELLVPRDLQTHVSKGAAIHSLLMNGLGKCIIQPITSEPILVVTKDSTGVRMLFPAGSPIPCNTVTIDDLVTSKDNQPQVELPICLGSPNKLLYNIVIKPQSPMTGFPINTPVKVTLEINADKLLLVAAECMGICCMIEPQNPFANKEMSSEERIVFVAEREANIATSRNGGQPTKQSLINLRNAYERVGNNFRAAETYELQLELYPNVSAYNNLGVLYSNAGNREKAIEYYEKAIQTNPSSPHPHCNLALEVKYNDRNRYRDLIAKALTLDPNYDVALIESAEIDKANGNHVEAKRKLQKVYDMMKQEYDNGTLGDYGYGWLARVANELGHTAEAKSIRASRPTIKADALYDDDNLTRTRVTEINRY